MPKKRVLTEKEKKKRKKYAKEYYQRKKRFEAYFYPQREWKKGFKKFLKKTRKEKVKSVVVLPKKFIKTKDIGYAIGITAGALAGATIGKPILIGGIGGFTGLGIEKAIRKLRKHKPKKHKRKLTR